MTIVNQNMFEIAPGLSVPIDEFVIVAIRSQGAGGQNVNKVATAVQIRFDIPASSLPEYVKRRLLALNDKRLSKAGVWVCKVQEARTQERNRQLALQRLQEFIAQALVVRRKRIPTKPSMTARHKRMDQKSRRGNVKKGRGPVTDF